MAPRIDVVLGIHCHQPVGNFTHVFEDAFQRSYRPFIEALAAHPHVKAVAHYTGPLWEFFDEHHPEFVDQLRALTERGQLELLGGGFYEPILAVLPERDALGQLRMLSDELAQRFDRRPRGMWLGERVWEPHLPALLAEAGVEYTGLDDVHFRRAGLEPNALYGRYLTEDQGNAVGVFPISADLRYLIPFRPVDEVLAHFWRVATAEAHPLLTLLDDGEKFGSWPGTHEWVYDQGWLERFFRALEANADWLRTRTLGEVVDERAPVGTVYLPTASYFELTEWALPINAGREMEALKDRLGRDNERFRPLLAGGTWRNFLTKYPEVNHMHKRMMAISRRLQSLIGVHGATDALRDARTALYRAQCNDAYWHGLFGGAYLPHLRDGIYRQLIEAEARMDRVDDGMNDGPRVEAADLDVDGRPETIVATGRWWACFHAEGGLLIELDDKPNRFNVLNTFARREELYHQRVPTASGASDPPADDRAISIHEIKTAKQPNLDRYLIYDSRRRAALHDLFLSAETTFDQLVNDPSAPIADWSRAPYEIAAAHSEEPVVVTASRRGSVAEAELALTKRIEVDDDALDVAVRLTNVGEHPWRGVYGLEFNLALLAGEAPDRYVLVDGRRPDEAHFAGRGEHRDVSSLRWVNEHDGVVMEFTFPDPVGIWRHPVYTVNNSEAGLELVYQATAVLFRWPLALDPGASVSRRLRYRVRPT